MSLYSISSPTLKCEQSILTYISASLSGSYGASYPSMSYYRGMDNEDKVGQAVIVGCGGCQEIYFGSRVYSLDTDIIVKENAYDYTRENFDVLAGNVFSLLTDSVTASAGINNYSTGFRTWQIQVTNFSEGHTEDVWTSTLSIRVVGVLVAV